MKEQDLDLHDISAIADWAAVDMARLRLMLDNIRQVAGGDLDREGADLIEAMACLMNDRVTFIEQFALKLARVHRAPVKRSCGVSILSL